MGIRKWEYKRQTISLGYTPAEPTCFGIIGFVQPPTELPRQSQPSRGDRVKSSTNASDMDWSSPCPSLSTPLTQAIMHHMRPTDSAQGYNFFFTPGEYQISGADHPPGISGCQLNTWMPAPLSWHQQLQPPSSHPPLRSADDNL